MHGWMSVETECPSRGYFLCYVVHFKREDASYNCEVQIELYFEPEKGWVFPHGMQGNVKFWKSLDRPIFGGI